MLWSSVLTLTTALGVTIPFYRAQKGNEGLEMSKCLPEIQVEVADVVELRFKPLFYIIFPTCSPIGIPLSLDCFPASPLEGQKACSSDVKGAGFGAREIWV